MNRKEGYKDVNKWRATCREQKNRYYRKTICGASKWYEWQDELIIAHEETDHTLSKIVGHSVGAIQQRRHRLKKWMKVNYAD